MILSGAFILVLCSGVFVCIDTHTYLYILLTLGKQITLHGYRGVLAALTFSGFSVNRKPW